MRQWLIDKRKALGLSRDEMAKRCDCSEYLLWTLENGNNTTHPNITARIAFHYGLTVEEFNDLVPEDRRVNELPEPKERAKKNMGKDD